MTIEKISKIDAASRQLDMAITLWFQEADPIPIHTLASSAHQIIHDVIHHHGGEDRLFDSPYIKPGFKKIAKKHFHKHYNFFKHANHDPDKFIDFNASAPEYIIVYSIFGLEQLSIKNTSLQLAFRFFFFLNNPSLLTDEGIESFFKKIPPNNLAKFKSLTRKQFLEIYHSATRE